MDTSIMRESFRNLSIPELEEKAEYYRQQCHNMELPPMSRMAHHQAHILIEELIEEKKKQQ